MTLRTENRLTKFFTSKRTDSNGCINHDYAEYGQYKNDLDTETPTYVKQPMDMNKAELIEYGQEMYGLKFNKGMSASMMVKNMYESVHGKEPTNRGRKKAI